MTMKPETHDFVIFCDPDSDLGKKTLALVKAHIAKANIQNIKMNEPSATWIGMIVNELGVEPKDLINRAHPYYQEHLRGHDWDEHGWLNILKKSPFLFKCPIVHFHGKSYLIETPTDLFKVESQIAHSEGLRH